LTWYLSAIVAALFYAAQMLGLRRLQRSYPIPVYMAYIWLGAGTVIGAIFEPLKLLALSGIAAGVTLVVEVGRGESQKESG